MIGSRRERRALEREQKRSRVPSKPNRSYWYWLIPCLAAFLIYAHSLTFGFIADDWGQIVNSPYLKSWSYLPTILTMVYGYQAPLTIFYYRPGFMVWQLIVHTFADSSAFGWHLSNVLLQVIVTFLVFKLGVEMLDSTIAASVTAFLFAIHPIHIEDVCYVGAGNEILYTGFALCALLFLIHGNRQQRPAYLWLSLAAWAVALFTKEPAISLLPVFAVLAFFGWPGNNSKKHPKMALAYVGVTLNYLLIRLAVTRVLLPTPGEASVKQTLLTSPEVMAFYLKKLLIPTHLSPFYFTWNIENAVTTQVWLTASAILLGAAAVAYLSRRWPQLALPAALVVLPLLPAINGIHYFRNLGSDAIHERYLYLSSVGMVLLIGLAAKYLLPRSRRLSVALGLLVAVVYVSLNLSQQNPYRDNKTWNGRYLSVVSEGALNLCSSGRQERAREVINQGAAAAVFYRLSNKTLFTATSFQIGSGVLTYLSPDGVKGTVPLSDLSSTVFGCLNPEMPVLLLLVSPP